MLLKANLAEVLLLCATFSNVVKAEDPVTSGSCVIIKKPYGCTANACLIAALSPAQSSAASSFCSTYTTATNTNTAAIPTYLSACDGPSQVSSACSCILQQTLPVTSTSSMSGMVGTTTTASPQSTATTTVSTSTGIVTSSATGTSPTVTTTTSGSVAGTTTTVSSSVVSSSTTTSGGSSLTTTSASSSGTETNSSTSGSSSSGSSTSSVTTSSGSATTSGTATGSSSSTGSTMSSSTTGSSSSSSTGTSSTSSASTTQSPGSSTSSSGSTSSTTHASTSSGSTSTSSGTSSSTTASTTHSSSSSATGSSTSTGSTSTTKSSSSTSASSSPSTTTSHSSSTSVSTSSSSSTTTSHTTSSSSSSSATTSHTTSTSSPTTTTTTTTHTTTASTTSSTTTSHSTTTTTSSSVCGGTAEATPYWLDEIKHQGHAAFNDNSTYQVYRNVKCFGAKGDGVTDDTAAINAAISASNRCGNGCSSSTTTPALVYFPTGTYIITAPILALYYTQLVGNPNNLPRIKGRGDFQGVALINGNPYYQSTNNFFRSVRNMILDTTEIPANQYGTGISWAVAQATSITNVRFDLSTASGNLHQGIYMTDGSGGFLGDLTFNNGKYGAYLGNQQFTSRNMTFNSQSTSAVLFEFDWGWTFKNININNVPVGLDMTNGAESSVMLVDSSFTNVGTAISSARNSASYSPTGAETVVIENLAINNVPVVVSGAGNTNLAGTTGTATINYIQGREYVPGNEGVYVQSADTPRARPASLLESNGYYVEKSRPLYQSNTVSDFVSVRDYGAVGDGITDDTNALQAAINSGKIVFVDFGVYLVSQTITIPAGVRMIGECWPRIMADGSSSTFSSMANPQPMLKVGVAGSSGLVEISDIVVQVKGPAAGAILIEWNLASSSYTNPAGMWDTHANVGGSDGTDLQVTQCPTSSTTAGNPDLSCIGAFMLMYVTPSAAGVYLENNWLWTADHELDIPGQQQITVFTGRGLLVESPGPVWLYGHAVEHNILYNYQFSAAADVFAGFIQTETPYYQSVPEAPAPFVTNTIYNDPNFATICAGLNANATGECAKSFGIRVVDSNEIRIYSAGLYSFFEDYTQYCIPSDTCQTNIVSIENAVTTDYVQIYNLNTIGTTNEIDQDGSVIAVALDNHATYPDTIAFYHN